MNSRVRCLCKRLHKTALRLYLRYRLAEARKDANVMEAEMLAAPQRLQAVRHFISDLTDQLQRLEAGHGR